MKKQAKLKGRLISWLVALLVLAVLISLLLELPFFLRQLYPIPYKDFIAAQAKVNNLEMALVAAMVKVESNFKPDAVSKADARGLMQLRPSTAAEVARQLGYPVGDDFLARLFEPEYNITLGTRYYSSMLRQFDGDEVLALAAYNAGPNKLRSWLEAGIWDGTWGNRSQIPYKETRNYLDRVRHYKDIYSKQCKDD